MKPLLTFSFWFYLYFLMLDSLANSLDLLDRQTSKNIHVGKAIYRCMRSITEAEDGNFQFLFPISSVHIRVFGKLIFDPL